MLEIVSIGLLLLIPLGVLAGCLPSPRRWWWGCALLAVIAGVIVTRWVVFERTTMAAVRFTEGLRKELPQLERDDEYVSSNRCLACHPGEHASWHRTYHRTMTQVAVDPLVRGKFDDVTIESDGLQYRVYRRGGEFWAEMPDPDEMMYVIQGGKPTPIEQIPRVHRRVVMSTGSHHYQTYWVASEKHPTVMQTLPLVYLLNDERWIPREAAFIRSPGAERMITQWNHHCIECHSTGGIPGLDMKTGQLTTRVGELGISCEACHGPGEKHIRANQDPLRRYDMHRRPGGDPTIVNPARLKHDAASQVCGQCHGVYVEKDEYAMRYPVEGVIYRPGQDLHKSRYYIQHPLNDNQKVRWEELEKNRKFFQDRWWDDGTVMAGGREYTALSASACYKAGQPEHRISCLSCHSMHSSEPADQLIPSLTGNQACVQCHQEPRYTTKIVEHTHHPVESSGSNCMNCHMPHTTYALFGGIRSHQIVSPQVKSSVEHGTPNACNLCHLDQTLGWTQQHLTNWYGHPSHELTEEQKTVSAAVVWLLKGHAAQRTLAAWHFGWDPARAVAGTDWMPPLLGQLLADSYGVVRYVAEHSLRKDPTYASVAYDFLAGEEAQQRAVQEVVEQWNGRRAATGPLRPEVLQLETGLDEEQLQWLLHSRDNRPVDIQE